MDKKLPVAPHSNDSKVSFQPITDGLGFHPFSDGLPYAPVGKNPKQLNANKSNLTSTSGKNGTGAVAAGVPKVFVPVAKKDSVVVPPSSPPPVFTRRASRGISYVFTRSLAYLFDVSFNSLLIGGALIGLVWDGELQVDQLLGYGVSTGIILFFLASAWGLIGLQEILFRTSLGKFLFRLKLGGSRVGILARTLLFGLSVGFAGIGIVWGLFQRRSCWHDLLTGIQPFDSGKNL